MLTKLLENQRVHVSKKMIQDFPVSVVQVVADETDINLEVVFSRTQPQLSGDDQLSSQRTKDDTETGKIPCKN